MSSSDLHDLLASGQAPLLLRRPPGSSTGRYNASGQYQRDANNDISNKENLYVRLIMNNLHFEQEMGTMIYEDNQGTIAMANSDSVTVSISEDNMGILRLIFSVR